MLTCKEAAERVTAYLERELSRWERVQFALHLAICRFCRRYVAQVRTTLALLRERATRGAGQGSMNASFRELFRAWRKEQHL